MLAVTLRSVLGLAVEASDQFNEVIASVGNRRYRCTACAVVDRLRGCSGDSAVCACCVSDVNVSIAKLAVTAILAVTLVSVLGF